MSKVWLFNFFCVLMISLSSHCMNFLPNIGLAETRLMREIHNVSDFLNKNAWTMCATGAAVAALCCYDKPVLWQAGVIGFNGLLMCKFMQMEKRLTALAQEFEESNTARINENENVLKQMDEFKREQRACKDLLCKNSEKTDYLLLQVSSLKKALTEGLQRFSQEEIKSLKKEIEVARSKFDDIDRNVVVLSNQQAALDDKFNTLLTLVNDVRKQHEKTNSEISERFAAIEVKVDTEFKRLNALIVTSFGEIKSRLNEMKSLGLVVRKDAVKNPSDIPKMPAVCAGSFLGPLDPSDIIKMPAVCVGSFYGSLDP